MRSNLERTIFVAIAGQSADALPVPDDAPAVAISAVSALAREMVKGELLGFLRPAVLRASWYAFDRQLRVCTLSAINPHTGGVGGTDLTRSGHHVVIAWSWGVLWRTDDWYEVGWHPDNNLLALHAPLQRKLWDALNPGKRPPIRRTNPPRQYRYGKVIA